MKMMRIIDRIKQSLKSGYYCNCHDRNHLEHQPSIIGLVGSYIGCAIMLNIGKEIFGDEDLEKKYCAVCHP